MLASDQSAIAKTVRANPPKVTRIRRRNSESFNGGSIGLMTFSLNATEGASNVALEQLMTAERTAPKNRI